MKPQLLHYETQGQPGKPTVVLLHGYLASSAYWRKVMAELSREHRVIAIDLLGFGRSPKPACSRYDYSAQLDSIERTLRHAGVDQPFKLIGHSMGSLIALRYAKTHPSQVNKLLLANMPVFHGKKQARREILGTNLVYRIGLQPGLHWLIWPLFKFATYARLLPEKVGGDAVARRAYIFQNSAISRLRSMRNVIFAATIESDLADLPIRTVILSGLQDRARYLENIASLKLRSTVQKANVLGGHHLPLTNPELFASFIG